MVFATTTLIQEKPMCHYQYLTLIEQEKIMFFCAQGKSLSMIASGLGRKKRRLRVKSPETSQEKTISRRSRRSTIMSDARNVVPIKSWTVATCVQS